MEETLTLVFSMHQHFFLPHGTIHANTDVIYTLASVLQDDHMTSWENCETNCILYVSTCDGEFAQYLNKILVQQ